ncbi:MAG: MCE family protein [Bacteroidales bacterium]|nr:MCE family protein [Bacteroidales bacterium]
MHFSKEFKIGFIAVITISLFIWGLSYLKGKNLLKPSTEYYAIYDNIDGLMESANVVLNGYKVGNVSSVTFDYKHSGKLIVTFDLEKRLKIPKNSIAQITSQSAISTLKDIQLILSESTEYYEPGDTLLSSLDKGIAGILDPLTEKAELILATLDTSLRSFNETLTEETRKDLKTTIKNIRSLTASLDQKFAEGGALDKSFDNLEGFTTTLKNSNDKIEGIVDNFYQLSDSLEKANIKSTIDKTNTVLDQTALLMTKIRSGEGSAGMLINNDTLYQNLENAAKNLEILLKDLNEHPKRYVHFSVFGKKDK